MHVLLSIGLVFAAPKQQRKTNIATAEQALADLRFEQAISAAQTVLSQSPNTDTKKRAYGVLFRAHFYSGRPQDSEAAINGLLDIAPETKLDPANDPPPVIEFFQQVKLSRQKPQPKAVEVTTARRQEPAPAPAVNTRKLVAYGALGLAGAALVVGVSTLAAGQVGSRKLASDIQAYNANPGRTSSQLDAINGRATALGALDITTMVMLGVLVAGGVTGGVLLALQPKDASVSVTGIGVGANGVALAGAF